MSNSQRVSAFLVMAILCGLSQVPVKAFQKLAQKKKPPSYILQAGIFNVRVPSKPRILKSRQPLVLRTWAGVSGRLTWVVTYFAIGPGTAANGLALHQAKELASRNKMKSLSLKVFTATSSKYTGDFVLTSIGKKEPAFASAILGVRSKSRAWLVQCVFPSNDLAALEMARIIMESTSAMKLLRKERRSESF
ncbi:MAG: hypothetical protein WAO58_10600 [Fimbriimonadaceae bacterium]